MRHLLVFALFAVACGGGAAPEPPDHSEEPDAGRSDAAPDAGCTAPSPEFVCWGDLASHGSGPTPLASLLPERYDTAEDARVAAGERSA
jgi:hypothetical protein